MITAKSYSLKTENGSWLGQVVLTSDGMFASVTDWGNFSYAFRGFGIGSFEEFILSINTAYFGTKIIGGLSYIAHSRKIEQACYLYAEKILPALQKVLREEIEELKNKL